MKTATKRPRPNPRRLREPAADAPSCPACDGQTFWFRNQGRRQLVCMDCTIFAPTDAKKGGAL